jgi:hypothetical protein
VVATLIGLSGALYSFLVAESIVGVLARTDLEQQIRVLESELGDLELRYVARKNELGQGSAEALGLLTPSEKIYITKRGLSSDTLSRNDEI